MEECIVIEPDSPPNENISTFEGSTKTPEIVICKTKLTLPKAKVPESLNSNDISNQKCNEDEIFITYCRSKPLVAGKFKLEKPANRQINGHFSGSSANGEKKAKRASYKKPILSGYMRNANRVKWEELMEQAIKEVLDKGEHVKKVALKFGLHQSTLAGRVKKKNLAAIKIAELEKIQSSTTSFQIVLEKIDVEIPVVKIDNSDTDDYIGVNGTRRNRRRAAARKDVGFYCEPNEKMKKRNADKTEKDKIKKTRGQRREKRYWDNYEPLPKERIMTNRGVTQKKINYCEISSGEDEPEPNKALRRKRRDSDSESFSSESSEEENAPKPKQVPKKVTYSDKAKKLYAKTKTFENLSEYEKLCRKNIEEKMAFLQSLEFNLDADEDQEADEA